jgi:hypothetical protein
VATLAVFAWSVEEMLECLTLVASRHSTLIVLDAGLRITSKADAAILHKAVQAFSAGRRSRSGSEAGLTGGEISAKRRSAAARAAAETIRHEWSLPSVDFPTAHLIARAGISLNTAKQYLGARPAAQKFHKASLKRADIRAKRGKRDE